MVYLSLLTYSLTYWPTWRSDSRTFLRVRSTAAGCLLFLKKLLPGWVRGGWRRYVAEVDGKSASRGRCDTGCTAPLEGCWAASAALRGCAPGRAGALSRVSRRALLGPLGKAGRGGGELGSSRVGATVHFTSGAYRAAWAAAAAHGRRRGRRRACVGGKGVQGIVLSDVPVRRCKGCKRVYYSALRLRQREAV
eukprot:scaffold50168_cov32-Phaeocystis_antarctica.AAC.2